MTRTVLALAASALFAGALLQAVPAHALSNRTWVSGTGNDGNPCTIAAPCATFQHAHDVTAAGGEVAVLSPGDFGPLTISKAISITNDGAGEAGIQQTGPGNAIFINASTGDIITLRGLVLDGAGTGGFGINFFTGSALHIQNCVIRNFEGQSTSTGLIFGPTGTSKLFVSDTIIYNNGNGANSGGILIQPTVNGSADVVFDRLQIENNVVGIKVNGSSKVAHVVLRDSVVSGNASNGLIAQGGNGAAFVFVVDSAFVVNNNGGQTAAGILATGAHGTVVLTDTLITRNDIGFSAINGGQVISYVTNEVDNNLGPDGAPTGTYAQQ